MVDAIRSKLGFLALCCNMPENQVLARGILSQATANAAIAVRAGVHSSQVGCVLPKMKGSDQAHEVYMRPCTAAGCYCGNLLAHK